MIVAEYFGEVNGFTHADVHAEDAGLWRHVGRIACEPDAISAEGVGEAMFEFYQHAPVEIFDGALEPRCVFSKEVIEVFAVELCVAVIAELNQVVVFVE